MFRESGRYLDDAECVAQMDPLFPNNWTFIDEYF